MTIELTPEQARIILSCMTQVTTTVEQTRRFIIPVMEVIEQKLKEDDGHHD